MDKRLSIWVNCKHAGPDLFVAKRAHAVASNLHTTLPLAIEFVFDLFAASAIIKYYSYGQKSGLFQFVYKHVKTNIPVGSHSP